MFFVSCSMSQRACVVCRGEWGKRECESAASINDKRRELVWWHCARFGFSSPEKSTYAKSKTWCRVSALAARMLSSFPMCTKWMKDARMCIRFHPIHFSVSVYSFLLSMCELSILRIKTKVKIKNIFAYLVNRTVCVSLCFFCCFS